MTKHLQRPPMRTDFHPGLDALYWGAGVIALFQMTTALIFISQGDTSAQTFILAVYLGVNSVVGFAAQVWHVRGHVWHELAMLFSVVPLFILLVSGATYSYFAGLLGIEPENFIPNLAGINVAAAIWLLIFGIERTVRVARRGFEKWKLRKIERASSDALREVSNPVSHEKVEKARYADSI